MIATVTVGSVGMWSVVVTLPLVQAEFGVDRSAATLPYTMTMVGVAFGSVLLGRLADRVGVTIVVAVGAACLGLGYIAAAFTTSLWQYALVHGLLIGALGGAATFGPVMAEASYWFVRHRGLAVSLCASGNYLAGAVWPGIIGHFAQTSGWRWAELGTGVFCLAAMLPLALLLRGRRPVASAATASRAVMGTLGFSPNGLQLMLIAAALSCCAAMAMPQVHIVAYCGDLGYGATSGTQMLSLMLGCGIASRVGSGWIADRIGGIRTFLCGSVLQALSLTLYLGFDSLPSLYIISALFGLVQGGLVPSYAIIVRECFPQQEAGMRFGLVLMASLLGMAFGGWISGWVFDQTLSYQAAFANGLAWNGVNLVLAVILLTRQRLRRAPAFA